jgi:CDP-glucose 4,6-dehydratase
MNKKFLVTGASGFLGAYFVNHLVNNYPNIDIIIVMKNKPNMFTSFLGYEGVLNKVNVVFGDITDYKLMETIITEYEIEYIFNFAALSIVRVCNDAPLVAFYNNVYSVAILNEIVRNHKTVKQLVHMTSDKAYGVADDLPYIEDVTTLFGMRPYESTKTLADMWSQMYQKNYESPITVVRSANLFGPGDPNMSRLIPQVCTSIAQDRNPWLYNGVAGYVREFVYVEDAVDFFMNLVNKCDANHELIKQCYNLSSGNIYSIESLVKKIISISGKKLTVDIKQKELDFYEIPEQYLSPNKVREMLAWEATYVDEKFDMALGETYEYYRELAFS